MCWLALLQLFLFFPPEPNPTPAYVCVWFGVFLYTLIGVRTMNWACLMFGGVMIIAGAWYFYRARDEYDGPVEYIRKDVD